MTSSRDAAFLPDVEASAAAEAPALGGALSLLHPLETVGTSRRTRPKHVGGKATALGRLSREGIAVPRGWVLDAKVFTRFVERALPRGYDPATLIKLGGRAAVDRAARARDLILTTPMPDDVARAIDELWRAVERDAPWGLAVRSSATCEDAQETSLAGLATTTLGARGTDGILAAIREVWASAVLPRALSYLAHAGIRDLSMAVVLQIMVRAEAAGVLFTGPPRGLEGETWKAGERLINATFGLGAPVVEGATTTDTVRLSQEGAVVEALIAHKPRALVVGAHGLVEAMVPDAMANAPALGTDVLRALADVARRVEAAGPGPFDIEFAVEPTGPGHEGPKRLWVLQARPSTGHGYPEGGGPDTVWSRANVGEALPGAATPLTWSIARAFSDRGFREAFAALGCKVPRGAVLVGNVHGRFYLNLTEFMRISAQVPGLGPRALLSVSGGASDEAITTLERQAAGVSKRGFVLRAPLVGPRLLAQYARLERDVEAFEARARRVRRAMLDMDLGILPDDALATSLKSARDLLDETGALMLRAASASLVAHLALGALLGRLAGARQSPRDDGETSELALDAPSTDVRRLSHALVGGIRELASADPGIAVSALAETARGDEVAKGRILRGEVRRPADLPPGATRAALEHLLDELGDRAVREAELSTPRWREDPTDLLAMVAAALRAPPCDPNQALARARATADHEMAWLETRMPYAQLVLVRGVVRQAQAFTRMRERMRSWVTSALGILRKIALDVDRRLRRIDPSLKEGSVFYCTYDELRAALASGRAEVGHVVRLRIAEHVRDAARPDPPATFIGRPPPVVLPPAPGPRLRGLPASPGVVEGRARVLEPGTISLDALQAGEILVSRATDVGLSPLFLIAAAVVTELGGPLSHAAIVAREYGVPAVVNVAGATLAIRTGDRLRVDGDRGVVEKLD